MRVAVLHQEVFPSAPEDERDVLQQVAAVADALHELGHEVVIAPAGKTPEELTRQVKALGPTIVFNLIESFLGSERNQYVAARALEELGVPFTGSGSRALYLTGDKRLSKMLLKKAQLPTPRWICGSELTSTAGLCRDAVNYHLVEEQGRQLQEEFARLGYLEPAQCFGYHFLLKSAWTHGSAGLGESLWTVTNLEEGRGLRRALAEKAALTGEPWFAEEYIDGREFNLSLVETREGPLVLPPAEIDFSAFPPGKLRIVGYRAKWDPESFEYQATPRRFDFSPADTPLLERLIRLAKCCWEVFGLSGYARVDFRVDNQGIPYILEINSNPCLSPDGGFAAAVAQANWSFPQLVAQLLEGAFSGASVSS